MLPALAGNNVKAGKKIPYNGFINIFKI
jgi:hypothetical protein